MTGVDGWQARGFAHGVVVSPHHLASEAGSEVLASGGNAIDAVIAANLALGVVAPYYCGVGGDLLAMVWDGSVHGYQSVGRSPTALTQDLVRGAQDASNMPYGGPHSVTVPGAVRGWFDLLDRWGTRSFGDLSTRATALAETGFVVSKPGAFRLRASVQLASVMHFDVADLAAVYGGHAAGSLLAQPILADTLRRLAVDGPDAMYRGEIGGDVVEALDRHGGVMSAKDLADHQAAWPEPMRATFAGREVLELPPPTQGVTALEMLRLADGLDLGPDSVRRLHLLIEISKLALEDRDRKIGDPQFMRIDPADLLSGGFVDERRRAVDPDRASMDRRRPAADGGTAYLCAADSNGLLVSLIQSNFTALGSGIHVPSRGINLHNRGAAFRLDDSPNGLAPAKLPMHTLIPGLVLRDDRPELVFGSMGGHAQAQIHLQLLTRMLYDEDDLQHAISAPRFSVDPGTSRVEIESRVPEEWIEELEHRGHEVGRCRSLDDAMGHAHAIAPLARGYLAAADPRAESAALGW